MKQNKETVPPISNEKRNIYVIEHITESLLILLEDKNIEDISISELCDNSGIGRASFYRSFNSKKDILRAYINKLFDGWKSDWEKNNNIPLSSGIGMIFRHFEEYKKFYHLLNEHRLIYLPKDVIMDIMGLKPNLPKSEAYAKASVRPPVLIIIWLTMFLSQRANLVFLLNFAELLFHVI